MINNKLKELLSNLLEINIEEITEDTNNENTESWDSLKHMEIIASIEDEFDITFSADEIIQLISYKKIKEILGEKGI
jgi:acyl carrier protein